MFITAYQNRNLNRTITITDEDGATVSVTSSDIAYVKIGRNGDVPVFEIAGGVASSNGSTLTNTNPMTLELKREDLDLAGFPPGTYDIEVGFMDQSDSDDVKHAIKGVFVLHGTQAGKITRAELAS